MNPHSFSKICPRSYTGSLCSQISAQPKFPGGSEEQLLQNREKVLARKSLDQVWISGTGMTCMEGVTAGISLSDRQSPAE